MREACGADMAYVCAGGRRRLPSADSSRDSSVFVLPSLRPMRLPPPDPHALNAPGSRRPRLATAASAPPSPMTQRAPAGDDTESLALTHRLTPCPDLFLSPVPQFQPTQQIQHRYAAKAAIATREDKKNPFPLTTTTTTLWVHTK